MADTSDNPLANGIRTTRLLARAVRERWPIPEQYRKPVMDRQIKIAIDPNSSAREATAATKTLLAADRLNQQDEQGPASEQHLHLHQHEAVDLSKATDAELDALEQQLHEIKNRLAANEAGRGEREALSVPLCEVGLA